MTRCAEKKRPAAFCRGEQPSTTFFIANPCPPIQSVMDEELEWADDEDHPCEIYVVDIGQSVESYEFHAQSFEQFSETQESTISEEVGEENSIDTNKDTIGSEDKDKSTSDSTQVYILPPYLSPVLLEHSNPFIDCESLSGDDHEQCASIPSNLTTLDGYASRSPSGTSLDRVYTTTQVSRSQVTHSY